MQRHDGDHLKDKQRHKSVCLCHQAVQRRCGVTGVCWSFRGRLAPWNGKNKTQWASILTAVGTLTRKQGHASRPETHTNRGIMTLVCYCFEWCVVCDGCVYKDGYPLTHSSSSTPS